MNLKLGYVTVLLLLGIFYFPSSSLSETETDFDGPLDIPTNLELSPWELYVLSDLTFKLTEKTCPKVNADILSALKDDLVNALKNVPKTLTQNTEFLPAYSHLVECLDYVMMRKGEIEIDEKKMKLAEAGGEATAQPEVASSEKDWVAPEILPSNSDLITTAPSVDVEEDYGAIGTISSLFWKFTSLRQWISGFLGRGKETSVDKPEAQKQVQEEAPYKPKDARKEQRGKHFQIYNKARQNIADFFHEVSRLVRKTCPAIHRPEKIFMREAFIDMTTWLTVDQHNAITLSYLYFNQHGLLKQITDCHSA